MFFWSEIKTNELPTKKPKQNPDAAVEKHKLLPIVKILLIFQINLNAKINIQVPLFTVQLPILIHEYDEALKRTLKTKKQLKRPYASPF